MYYIVAAVSVRSYIYIVSLLFLYSPADTHIRAHWHTNIPQPPVAAPTLYLYIYIICIHAQTCDDVLFTTTTTTAATANVLRRTKYKREKTRTRVYIYIYIFTKTRNNNNNNIRRPFYSMSRASVVHSRS